MILCDLLLREVTGSGAFGLEGAFHDAVTGMAVLDLDGRFRAVNPALCRMIGRSEAELIGLSTLDVTHPEDRSRSAATMVSLQSGETGTHQARKRYVRPDGSIVVVVRTTTVLRDPKGEAIGLFSQIVDVTDTAEAQEAVRRSEKRFRALVAHASEMTVLIDPDATIIYASPAADRLLGESPASLQGHSVFEFLHPDDLDRARLAFGGHLAKPGQANPVEYRVKHRDGSWRFAEVVATNLFEDPDVGAFVVNVRDVTERRRYEDQLAASEQRFRALVANSWDVITVHASNGECVYCSPGVTAQLGYRPEELTGTNPLGLVHPDDGAAAARFIDVVAGRREGTPVEYRFRHKDGSWRWLESTGHNRLDDAAVEGVVVTTRDVTSRRRRGAQQEAVTLLSGDALRGGSIESLFARAVDLVAGVLGVETCVIVRIDGEDQARVVTQSALGSSTISAGLADRVVALACRAGSDGTNGAASGLADDEEPGSGLAVPIPDESGDAVMVVWAREREAFVRDDVSYLEATANVLAAAIGHRRAEDELRRRALHDDLTGLPNRVLLLDRLDTALGRLGRHPGNVAVLFVDTDDFKLVNDSLGHAAGDTVVLSVAERIAGVLRRCDTVARFGGDEFVVLCEDTDSRSAGDVADRIHQALAAPINVVGRSVVVTASIGIAVTEMPLTADDLLAQADTAMYAAKQAGKDRSAFFDIQMRQHVNERLDASSRLRDALRTDAFRVFYQPVVKSDTGAIVGAEALVRWQHPTDGLLGPDRFIDFAESSGLILPIGAWVLEEACRQAADWDRQGLERSVSINVSARQLAEADIVDTVRRALAVTDVNPRRILLEVTESAVMGDLQRAATVMEALKALGVRVGMDDFGTGYSSLAYLANLPFDFVKIDRSFLARFVEDRRAAALLASVSTLCSTLGLAAIAEGVETEQQLCHLRELGIPYVQGFLFGRPVPPADFGDRQLR